MFYAPMFLCYLVIGALQMFFDYDDDDDDNACITFVEYSELRGISTLLCHFGPNVDVTYPSLPAPSLSEPCNNPKFRYRKCSAELPMSGLRATLQPKLNLMHISVQNSEKWGTRSSCSMCLLFRSFQSDVRQTLKGKAWRLILAFSFY